MNSKEEERDRLWDCIIRVVTKCATKGNPKDRDLAQYLKLGNEYEVTYRNLIYKIRIFAEKGIRQSLDSKNSIPLSQEDSIFIVR